MISAGILDYVLAGFWVSLGTTLLLTLHRQSKALAKLSGQLGESKQVLDECRGHLQMANVTIREVASFSRMLTHVSTELRKPLDVIAQTAWILKHQGVEDSNLVERYSDNILTETKRLGDTVDGLLHIVEQEAERTQQTATAVQGWAQGRLQRVGATSHV